MSRDDQVKGVSCSNQRNSERRADAARSDYRHLEAAPGTFTLGCFSSRFSFCLLQWNSDPRRRESKAFGGRGTLTSGTGPRNFASGSSACQFQAVLPLYFVGFWSLLAYNERRSEGQTDLAKKFKL